MNCVFICVFNQEKYVDMFLVMLESLLLFGGLTKDYEILVYTSTAFMELIMASPLFAIANTKSSMVFAINDNYTTVDLACKARLDLFDLPQIDKYSRILYLDTDIIVRAPISDLFALELEDKLYALREGRVDDLNESHGRKLFILERFRINSATPAFTTGILLFNNCARLRELFSDVKKLIIKRPIRFHCADQPFIVFMAFKKKMYDNRLMCDYAVNNSTDLNSGKIIHHFTGGPGVYGPKIPAMTEYLTKLKELA